MGLKSGMEHEKMEKTFSKKNGEKALWAIFFCLFFAGRSAPAENQSWLNDSLRISFAPKLALIFTHEFRNREFGFMDHYLANVQGGIEAGITKNTYAAFLYKRENTKKPEFLLNENRFTFESGWKTKLSQKTNFDLRFRTEGRVYDRGKAANHFRFRLRLRLTTQMKLGNYTLKPFIATEPFANTLTDTIHQNRFYLGASFPLGQNSTFVLNYIRQDTKNKDPLHILNAGFQLKF